MKNLKINLLFPRFVFFMFFVLSLFFVSFSFVGAETYVSEGEIAEDTTWTTIGSPYIIQSSVSVLEDAKLTIESGVVVKFEYNTGLFVYGGLEILGEENNSVIFTSALDPLIPIDEETYEGDLPYAGDWDGVFFQGDKAQVSLNNILIKYADTPLSFLDVDNATLGEVYVEGYNEYLFILNSNLEIDKLEGVGLLIFDNSDVSIGEYIFINTKEDYYGRDPEIITLFNQSSLDIEKVELEKGSVLVFQNSSLNIESGFLKNTQGDVFSVYQESILNIKNFVLENIGGIGFWVFQSGKAFLENIDLDNAGDSFVDVFGQGEVEIKNSKFKNNQSLNFAMSVHDGGILKIENSTLENGLASGVAIFSGGFLDLKKVLVKNFVESGVVDYSSTTIPNSLVVRNSTFTENNVGIDLYNHNLISQVSLFENYIYKNKLMGLRTFIASTPVTANKNYWGDKTGPKNINNPLGLGDEVSEGVDFNDWCKSESCKNLNPVIIIPGITGSYLFEDEEDGKEVWLRLTRLVGDVFDLHLNKLILNEDGTQDNNKKLKTGDIIRKVSSFDVFDGLIKELENEGYVENENLFVFAYDWRRSNAHSAELLKNKIEEVIGQTGMEKVDILAHSMGGLITKKYIFDNGEDAIGKIVFLGTPHYGAPKTFKALMYGDDMGYGFDWKKIISFNFLNTAKSKLMSQNMPAVYELLPSKKYFEKHGSYVKDYRKYKKGSIIDLADINLFSFDVKNKFLNLVNYSPLSFENIKKFMLDEGRNPLMYPFADNLHRDIDELEINSSVYNFVGCGSGTVGGFNLKTKIGSLTSRGVLAEDDYELLYVNGDGTVPLISADGVEGANVYFAKGYGHGTLPSSFEVKKNILNILKNEEVDLSDVISLDDAGCNIEGLSVSIHSPVNLHIYDEEGNHTGLDEEGNIEYGIEGVEFDMIEDKSFVFLPKGQNYRIEIEAYDVGYFDFYVNVLGEEGEVLEKYSWEMVPIENNNLKGEISLLDDFNPDLLLSIDKEGDGDFESSYPVFFEGFSSLEIEKEETKNQTGSYLFYNSPKNIILEEIKNLKTEDILLIENIGNKEENKNIENLEILKIEDIKKETDFVDKENQIDLTASVKDTPSNGGKVVVFAVLGLGLIMLLYKVVKL